MDEGQTPLSDLLGNDEDVQDEIAEESVPEQEAGQPRDEAGRFAPKGETEGEPPAPVEKPAFDGAATIDERRKRQEAQHERDALRAELEALKTQFQAIQQPPAPPPSIWEDEQGWQQNFGGQVVSEAVQQATFNARLDMSEMMTRQANPDFEEVKAEFLALAEKNPTLREQALSDPHPWNKAYQIAKNHRTMTELGATNVADLEAKLREKIMAEMQEQAPLAPVRPGLPPTLAGARNVGARTGPAWSGPPSLDDLLA